MTDHDDEIPPTNDSVAWIPGVAALMLTRGCPEDRLDEALAQLGHTRLPRTLQEAVEHVDRAITQLA